MAEVAKTQKEIDALLNTAQSVSIDGMSQTARSISDRIALENHESRKRNNPFGMTIGKLKPPRFA